MGKKKRKLTTKQIDRVNEYVSENYQRINLVVPTGRRDVYKQFAKEHGFDSLNVFAVNAIEIYMKLSENSDNSIAPDGET